MYMAGMFFVLAASQGLGCEVFNTISVGCTTTMECPIYGNNYTSLTWICQTNKCYDNQTISMEQKIKVNVDELYNRTYLIITHTTLSDYGYYWCTYMVGNQPFICKFQLSNDTVMLTNVSSPERTSNHHGFSIKEECNNSRPGTIITTIRNSVYYTTPSVDNKAWFPVLWYVVACGTMTVLLLFRRLLLRILKQCSRENIAEL